MKVLAGKVTLTPYIVPDSFVFVLRPAGNLVKTTYVERGTFGEVDRDDMVRIIHKYNTTEETKARFFGTDEFVITETRTESREKALQRFFNELIFQMKCIYPDNELHRMVDQVVVSEVLEDGGSLSSSYGLFPGIGFYGDDPAIDGSSGLLDSFISVVEILSSLISTSKGTGIVSVNPVGYGKSGIFKSLQNVPIPRSSGFPWYPKSIHNTQLRHRISTYVFRARGRTGLTTSIDPLKGDYDIAKEIS